MESSNIHPVESRKFKCRLCDAVFAKNFNLKRHDRLVHNPTALKKCELCNVVFTRVDNLKRHISNDHEAEGATYTCDLCGKSFSRKDNLLNHIKWHSRANTSDDQGSSVGENMDVDETCVEDPCNFSSAINGKVQTHTFYPVESEKDHLLFMSHSRNDVQRALCNELKKHKGVKWYLSVFVRCVRGNKEEQVFARPCFRSKCYILLQDSEFDTQFNQAFATIGESVSNYQKEGSNWTIERIYHLELRVAVYKPLSASTYIDLPRELKNTKSVINVKNDDNKCFLWSVLAHIHPQTKNAQRVAKYAKWESDLNMNGIDYPVSVSQIAQFEKLNNISVNVYAYEREMYPLKITNCKCEQHVNLLLVSNGDRSHYCLIKNLNRLLASLTKHKREAHYCNLCLHRFSTEARLNNHHTYCNAHEPQKTSLPNTDNNVLKFKNYNFSLRVPFVIYADFECFSEKISGCSQNPEESHTTKLTHHEPSGFAYVIIGPTGQPFKPPVVYNGADVVNTFLDALIKEETQLSKIIQTIKPLIMTEVDEHNYKTVEHCFICWEKLNEDRVRDHDHLTGLYRGAAHSNCNLNYKLATHIPVIFHNLRGYDSHLIMQHIGESRNRRISVIANNIEKYVSFSWGDLRFLDSLQFLNASLETLVNNLVDYGIDKFKILGTYFDASKIQLLLRKGVFPYDFVDCNAKLKNTQLPPHSAFFNVLKSEHISDEDYQHATKVWDKFDINTLGEYQDLYVKSDVLLLADVFESFRALCLENYDIDPLHTYTAPGLAWASCLKMTRVELELFTDPDMYLFMENGIRGGVSMISKRFSRANNQYMVDYVAENPSKHIVYWDCNNLYGVAMSKFLPLNGFRWLSESEITLLDVTTVPNEDENGYILEVDLEYPKELHDMHNDCPLAPEKMVISDKMISPYSKQLLDTLNISLSKNVTKLVTTLHNKTKYILHYQNLKQYLLLGMKITKVHRVLKFTQSAWLKPYIDFNTIQRQKAKNNFEKDLFKLLNNAVFGKTMENLRNRVNIELVTSEKRILKLIASPAFESFEIFSNNLVAVKSKKVNLFLNRPIYAGFTILDVSKTIMYDFHYNYTKRKYDDKAKLLFTDTDSLCYEIETRDVHNDMKEDAELFDTSNFSKDHFLYSEKNKKVLGKMKDELDGKIIKEFVGLRSKMYSILEQSGVNKKVGKGIVKATLKKSLTHTDYKASLYSKEIHSANMYTIRSFKHDVFTIKQKKVTLSPFDDKRYILNNGIDTLAYGHYKINMQTD